MSALELLKVVGQGGFPVLFALLLIGLFYVIMKLGPGYLSAWNEQNTRLAKIETKLDSLISDAKDSSDLARDGGRETGSHRAVADADRIILERDRRR